MNRPALDELQAHEHPRALAMQIPAKYTIAHRARGEVFTFECGACRHVQPVLVRVVGAGVSSTFQSPHTAARRASHDAEAKIDRAMARARCPRCGRRETSGLLRLIATWGGTAVFMSAVLFAAFHGPTWIGLNMREADLALMRGLLPWFLAPTLVVLGVCAIVEYRGWSRQVTWLDADQLDRDPTRSTG